MNLTAIQGNIVSMHGNLLAMDARKPFIIEVDTTKGNGFNSFTLPLTNHTTDIYVKVSDGQRFTINNYLDPKRTINFASAGVYTIELRGQCGWSFNNTGDCQKISIKSWGDFQFNYLSGGFYGCTNIGINGGLPLAGSINATNVTDVTHIFVQCELQYVPDDTFNRAFNALSLYGCLGYNNIASINDKVFKPFVNCVDMSVILRNNPLTDIHDNAFTSFGNVINANAPFYACNLSTIKKAWNDPLVNVVNGSQMFLYCGANSIEQGAFDAMLKLQNARELIAFNSFTSLPDKLLYYNSDITDVGALLAANFDIINFTGTIFNTSNISKITDFRNFTTALHPYLGSYIRHTGLMQNIWDYASPAASKLNAFKDQTDLTNYNSIPNEWKGL